MFRSASAILVTVALVVPTLVLAGAPGRAAAPPAGMVRTTADPVAPATGTHPTTPRASPGPAAMPTGPGHVRPASTSADVWTDISPIETPSPPPLAYASMVYDSADSELVLFGGFESGVGATAYTWVLSNWNWINLTPNLSASPSPRFDAQMSDDLADGGVLLFGGTAGGTSLMSDTWLFRAGVWSNLSATGILGPPGRYGGGMADDFPDYQVVLFGGFNHSAFFNDTWAFASGTWTRLPPGTSPAPRVFPVMRWDDRRGRIVLLGGASSLDPGRAFADEWTFSGGSWTNATNGPEPTDRYASVGDDYLADGPTHTAFILFGGFQPESCTDLGDTWNESGTSWAQLTLDQAPSPRDGAVMVYDYDISHLVLFGGEVNGGCSGGGEANDTWIYGHWSGPPPTAFQLTLTQLNPPGPAPYTASWSAHATGGIAPYFISIEYDNTTGTGSTSSGWFNASQYYRTSGTFAATALAMDGLGHHLIRFVTIGVGTTVVANWYPPRDSYAFSNYGSFWSGGGNCYGYSDSELLYWQHDILGWSDRPYLPEAAATENNQLHLPSDPVHTLDATSFAIMLHQVADPRPVATSSAFDSGGFAQSWSAIGSWIGIGLPSMMSLGPNDRHEVVVYGYQVASSGLITMDISDPNDPGQTSYAYYNPSTENFSYNFSYQWYHFATPDYGVPAVLDPGWIFPSFLGDNVSVQDFPSKTQADEYVFADTPVRLVTSTGIADFGVPADSQSFYGTIPGSIGIAEGSLQAYEMPYIPSDVPVVFDPTGGTSGIATLWPGNESGRPVMRGAVLTVDSGLPHTLRFQGEPSGFTATVGNVSVQAQIQLFEIANGTPTSLRATELNLSAGSTLNVSVTDWTMLNSTATPTVVAVVTPSGGTAVSYPIVNGQVGLSPTPPPHHGPSGGNGSVGSSAPPVNGQAVLLGVLGGLVVGAVATFLVQRFRARGRTEGRSAPTTRPGGPPPGASGGAP